MRPGFFLEKVGAALVIFQVVSESRHGFSFWTTSVLGGVKEPLGVFLDMAEADHAPAGGNAVPEKAVGNPVLDFAVTAELPDQGFPFPHPFDFVIHWCSFRQRLLDSLRKGWVGLAEGA